MSVLLSEFAILISPIKCESLFRKFSYNNHRKQSLIQVYIATRIDLELASDKSFDSV